MATPEDSAPGPSIVARIEERWLTPLRHNAFATRTWNAVTVAVICAIYAGVIGWMLYRDAHQPPVETAKLEEIPVEIVQPPPPPPPPKPEPKPPEVKQEIEKPASSAPRAPSEDKVETDRMDEATRAPKADAPKDGEKAPPPEPPAAPNEANDHDDATAKTAEKDDVLKKDAEALTKLLETPPQKPEKVAKAPPKAKQKREKTAVQRLAGKSDLPDYKLARPTKKAPITGGNEDNRYLANVFAKIMSKYRPVAIDPGFGGTVTVAFHVDDDGTILAMQIAQSSGDEELDEAAISAVSRASPLPPLPPGAPHALIARIGARSAGRALRMGDDE